MNKADYERTLLLLDYYKDKLSCKSEFELAAKILRGWEELKETIVEMSTNDGTCNQQEVCKFLASLMNVIETGQDI